MLAINPHQRSEAAQHLCETWREWMHLLSRYVRAERNSGITDRDYRQRHVAVLEAIAKRRMEVGDNLLLRRVESLAAPWISLEACRVASDSIKRDLLSQCQDCEQELSGLKRRRRPLPWRSMAIATAVGVVITVLLADVWVSDSHSLLAEATHGLFRVGFWIRHSTILEKFAAAAAAMLALGWWTTHSLRSN